MVEQFGNPRGALGALAGMIMRMRPSNRERSSRVLALLGIRPDDVVLEVGFGPGLAIEGAAALATEGKVVGVDHSPLMLEQATRRNALPIAVGRVELLLGTTARVAGLPDRFDKVFSINVFMFWRDPAAELRSLRRSMKPGGTMAVALQPRRKGASEADVHEAAAAMSSALRDAGFVDVRVEILEMSPVDTACALGVAPPAE
jgi:SAM-dependent methyltransferase